MMTSALEFDLRLADIASNVEPGKTGPMEIGLGFLNLAGATSTNFMRGFWGGAPNVAEFDYYPAGYYDLRRVHLGHPPDLDPRVHLRRQQQTLCPERT